MTRDLDVAQLVYALKKKGRTTLPKSGGHDALSVHQRKIFTEVPLRVSAFRSKVCLGNACSLGSALCDHVVLQPSSGSGHARAASSAQSAPATQTVAGTCASSSALAVLQPVVDADKDGITDACPYVSQLHIRTWTSCCPDECNLLRSQPLVALTMQPTGILSA